MLALTLAILIRGPKLDADAIRDSDTSSQEVQDRSPIFPMMFTLDSSCKSIRAEVKKRLTDWRVVLGRAGVRVQAFGFGQKCTDWQVVMVSASLVWPVCAQLLLFPVCQSERMRHAKYHKKASNGSHANGGHGLHLEQVSAT